MSSEFYLRGRAGTHHGMQHTNNQTASCSFTLSVDPARWLDLQAGVELAHGHTQAAEMLARRAADLREARA